MGLVVAPTNTNPAGFFFTVMVYNGWIKIHRQLLDWEWYTDANTMRLFLHLLLTANIEEKKLRGITIKRGELVTSVGSLGEQLNLSSHQIRLSLDKLKSSEEVAIKTTNKYSIVTICKYDTYQSEENQNGKQNDNQTANKWQTNGKQTATTKEYKNIRIKENNIVSLENFETKENQNNTMGILENNADKSATQTKTLDERMEDFKIQVLSFRNQYSDDMLEAFFNYWTEHNENGKKMRFEQQKIFNLGMRLSTWQRNEQKRNFKKQEQKLIEEQFDAIFNFYGGSRLK